MINSMPNEEVCCFYYRLYCGLLGLQQQGSGKTDGPQSHLQVNLQVTFWLMKKAEAIMYRN